MIAWAIIFLFLALLSGILGLGVLAGTAAIMANALFLIFAMLYVFLCLVGKSQATR
jgi:uncharacterized membrane protein YtjA (UPF0391 family)